MMIATARDAADLLAPHFTGATTEKVVAAHLDAGQRLTQAVESESHGADDIELPMRAIFCDALRLGTFGLIVAHNHPSGDPEPSPADLAATRELAAAAGSLGIRFYDHLIFGRDGECRSLRALGLL
jgi:DNA repair protein RadC